MTVFGVLNFGDQGNAACVNIYMHVMSKKKFIFICFFTFINYSVNGDFFYQWYKIYCCHESEEDNVLSAILTNKKCIFKWCAFFRFCKCFNVLSFVKMKLAYF